MNTKYKTGSMIYKLQGYKHVIHSESGLQREVYLHCHEIAMTVIPLVSSPRRVIYLDCCFHSWVRRLFALDNLCLTVNLMK